MKTKNIIIFTLLIGLISSCNVDEYEYSDNREDEFVKDGKPTISADIANTVDVSVYSTPSASELDFKDICIIHTRNNVYVGKEFIQDAKSQALQHFGNKTTKQDFKLLTIQPQEGDTSYIVANLGWTDTQYDAVLPSVGSSFYAYELHDIFDGFTLTYKKEDDFLPVSGKAVWVTKDFAYSTMYFALARITVRFSDTIQLTPFLTDPNTHIYFQVQNDSKEGCIFPKEYGEPCSHGGFYENESHYTDGTKGTLLGDTVYAWDAPMRNNSGNLAANYNFATELPCIIFSIYRDDDPSYERHIRFDLVSILNNQGTMGSTDPNKYWDIKRGYSYDFVINSIADLKDLEYKKPEPDLKGIIGYQTFKDAYYYPSQSILNNFYNVECLFHIINNAYTIRRASAAIDFVYDGDWMGVEYTDSDWFFYDTTNFKLPVPYSTNLLPTANRLNRMTILSSTEAVFPTLTCDTLTYNSGMSHGGSQAYSGYIIFNCPPNGASTVLQFEVGNLITTYEISRFPAVDKAGASIPITIRSVPNNTYTAEQIPDWMFFGKTPTEMRKTYISNSIDNDIDIYLNVQANTSDIDRTLKFYGYYTNTSKGRLAQRCFHVIQRKGTSTPM